MKRIILLSLIGFALCFTSCKKVGSISGIVTIDGESVSGATVEIT